MNFSLEHIILFVENPFVSAQFYSTLLNMKPVEQSPTFVMFVFPNGLKLGLWSRYTAEPLVFGYAGAQEICFEVNDVDLVYEKWGAQGITIIQKPTDMDFGRTFVAIDPDKNRIRVYKMHKE